MLESAAAHFFTLIHIRLPLMQSHRESRNLEMLCAEVLDYLSVSLLDLLHVLSILSDERQVKVKRKTEISEFGIEVRNGDQRGNRTYIHSPRLHETSPMATQASFAIDSATRSPKLENIYMNEHERMHVFVSYRLLPLD